MGGTRKEEFLGILTGLANRTNEEWMGAVSKRKVEEAVFHDKSHQRNADQENKKFYRSLPLRTTTSIDGSTRCPRVPSSLITPAATGCAPSAPRRRALS